MALYDQGRVEEAARAIDDVPVFEEPSGEFALAVLNLLVCVDVASGHYARALARRAAWSLRGQGGDGLLAWGIRSRRSGAPSRRPRRGGS